MKKLCIGLSFILLMFAMIGCDLNIFNQHELYFYSLAGEGNNPSSRTIKYRSDGHTIIMSRGDANKELTHAEAISLQPDTTFTLTLDGNPVTTDGVKSVKELRNGWNVVQYYSLGVLSKGTYTLIGKTVMKEKPDTRENTVTLTIK